MMNHPIIQAPYILRVRPLGIAEDHSRPEGRQLVIDLINQGHVTNLFVELHADFDNAGQKLAQAVPGAQLVIGVADYGNQIRLVQVIMAAINANVPVHCADGKSFWRNPRRNRSAANALTAHGGPGSLILFGGNHFEGLDSIQSLHGDMGVIVTG